jgi:copper chaperone NosL
VGGYLKGVVSYLFIFCLITVISAAGPTDSELSGKGKCLVCGMFVSIFVDWNATIAFKDANRATFDGSKCMFKYYLNIKKYDTAKNNADVTAISVKDYYSKTSFDGRQAFFIIWSNVYGPMGHEPIPFEKESDAKKFLKEHKGKKIIRFKDVDMKLIVSLDNP